MAVILTTNAGAQPKGKAGEYSDVVHRGSRIHSFLFFGARLRKDLVREGHPLGKDDWLLLDLYGTTHDARLFPQPAVFNPKRESSWRNGDFRFIPQGGGQPETSHRCPGEKMTVAILQETLKLVCRIRLV